MRANYIIVEEPFAGQEPIIIKDVGPWDRYSTVTNAAEMVVAELYAQARLVHGQPLYYFDSEGQLDEIVHEHGQFRGFRPGPGSQTEDDR